MTAYKGLDYGLGRANIDVQSGIRFGVIAQNSINLDILSEFESEYGEPHCPKCGQAVEHDGLEYACADCSECFESEECFPDESLGISYDRDGYKIQDCLDSDLMILSSPYFTYAQYCSPCVPGAINLDSPMSADEGVKGYCLGHDWFDEDKAPYRVYRVVDSSEVFATSEVSA